MQRNFLPTLALLALSLFTFAQKVPSPKEHFGFDIGEDYMLSNYTQTEAYFKKLATSDRVKLIDIGKTEEGRSQYMLVVTSPENHKKLARYQEIATKMARAEGINEQQARGMAAEGKAVVWIDGGLHSNETVGTMQLIETAWQLVSRNDAENKRVLDNVVVLLTHANPDGHEMMANWYMRNATKEKRSLEHLPKLYEKYAGHDNNRDFYMMNLKETQNIGRQLFVDWIPQIMYNHHQRGPAGSVLAGPPYRDPFNHVFDAGMITGIDAVGAAMINRLNAENKPGFTRLNGSVFSTWYNGGLRTTTHFHNMIGILTEIIGGPTPETVPLVPSRLIPNNNTPNPITPQKWLFKQSIDYSLSLNYAILDYASRNSDHLLYNIYRMGMNSIERGSKDYWTPYPARIDAIAQANAKLPKKPANDSPLADYETAIGGGGVPVALYDTIFKKSALRDPRGYIIPADQADFPTAVKFINTLIRTGILVHKATAEFVVNNKKYPAGSYIVKTAQAFRPHVIDMFEPQDYPNDFQYPGGPPIRPYDAAGWTLTYQMGVKVDRMLEPFEGPFERINYGEVQTANAKENAATAATPSGYLLSSKTNDAFVVVNDLLKSGSEVFRLPNGSENMEAGAYYIPINSKNKAMVGKAMADLGLKPMAVAKKPTTTMTKITPARVALWDNFGGSMPSGWTRWLFEQYHFGFDVVYSKNIDAGDLRKKYDVIVFVRGAIPSLKGESGDNYFGPRREPKEEDIPAEYHALMGKMTNEKSIPAIKKFMEEGGRVVTIGTSTSLAYHLGLDVKSALVEIVGGQERNLSGDKYYVPGSLLRVQLDSTQNATWGMASQADVYFDNSPVFRLGADAIAKGKLKPLAWFTNENPLRSGWAYGQNYLKNGVVAFEAPYSAGKMVAFSPEITYRAQSHSTFKLLFNQLYN